MRRGKGQACLSAAAICLGSCLCLGSCKGLLKQADLEEFVDTGLTSVLIRSVSFSPCSADADRIPTSRTINCEVEVVNPKLFDVSYSLSCDLDGASFTALPLASPLPKDATHLSFSFTLDAGAEHRKLSFELGKYVASINKTYEPETFSIICDSPPDAASRVSAARNGSDLSVLGIIKPKGAANDDLARLRVTLSQGGGAAGSTTYAIGSLPTTLAPSPFSSAYDYYLVAPASSAGKSCSYSTVFIDEAGQESPAASATSAPGLYPFSYDANGATGGAPPATVGRTATSTVTVAGQGGMERYAYVFTGWNTAANGSGDAYAAGSSYPNMPPREVVLYAQWYFTGIQITYDLTPRGLAFDQNLVSLNKGDSVSITCADAEFAAGTSSWVWYLDGQVMAGRNAAALVIDSSEAMYSVGEHSVGCTLRYGSLSYSANFKLVIVQ
jgi:uncharacterized repeat protein (TIGR02543 family)